MKRIEAKDLRPGDVFEYEYEQNWGDRQKVLKRDTVVAKTSRYGYPVAWSAWFTVEEGQQTSGGVYEVGDVIRFQTEVGQNNHGYVELPAQRVILLIEEGDQ